MSDRPRQTICRLFAAGSCRYGAKCKFLHQRSVDSTASGSNTHHPSTASQRHRQSTPQSPRSNGPPPANIPPRVCTMYWQTGACSRGFECSFKHERNSAASTAASIAQENADPPDFFSTAGLATSTGAVREQRVNMKPSEAHNHIKPFLRDNYHFDSAAKMQGFVRVLASVNDRNPAWNSDSAQSFLDSIVKGNGIIRISDVLRFQPVSHATGNGTETLSFQRSYFPLFEFFASDLVLKSTWQKNINHLYTVIEDNYDVIQETLRGCIGAMIQDKSWRDPTPYLSESLQCNLDGAILFKTVSTLLLQYFHRFKGAIRNHPEIVDLIIDFSSWFDDWSNDVAAIPPRFADNITATAPNVRRSIINHLREQIDRVVLIVQRESDNAQRLRRPVGPAGPMMTAAQREQAEVMRLAQAYDPPGELNPEGPRHDNDFLDIAQIRIAPTHQELLSSRPPYLPFFLPSAPHHLPADSMERLLDIQFRLLREELIAPIRSSLMAIYNDLGTIWQSRQNRREPTKLEGVLAKLGGAYKTSGYDSVFFFIYTNVHFSPVKAERRDLTVGLLVDAPAGPARDPDAKKRFSYWEHSKRLQSGSLVALVLVTRTDLKIFLGVTASFSKDIAESSKASEEHIQVRVTFFDPEVELMALRRERASLDNSSYAFLVDNNVMFEASRPFLHTLQTVEPTEIPFARYFAKGGDLSDIQIMPPRYATVPRFVYNIQCLMKKGLPQIDNLDLSRPNTVITARQQLLTSSILDPSQVDAVLDTLTREVSLIQGPPGTGKSFTGREILRVLFASKVKPIVLIAYTNHALDHMLTDVLDAGITKKLVRLGSRSSDERIAEYTLDKLEKVASTANLDRSIGRQYHGLKVLEEQMEKVMESIQLPALSAKQIEQHLEIHYPEHAGTLLSPPYWIQELMKRMWADEEENGEWHKVNKNSKVETVQNISRTFYGFWKEGADIQFVSPRVIPPEPQRKNKKKKGQAVQPAPVMFAPEDPRVAEFFLELGFGTQRPLIPLTDRSVDRLIDDYRVWTMSLSERARLSAEWERTIRLAAYEANLDDYKALRAQYKEACQEYNDIRDETRRRLMSNVDLIGCTTTGAAKLTSLISSIQPRVLMVEEAGQVLEAHVLTSLVSSVHHLICIGDPQQLRPTLATFALSMDSARGQELFKFDRSLMERLADNGLPMTQINVQRRMRPAISDFIRKILYPNLVDNELVMKYPHVQGMQKDVYFLNHTNPEGGLEDSVSKYNTYEVEMIKDLVLYFLRQGEYSGQGDIAVLCAYLGQLQKVRSALKDLKIAVSVDERDEDQLARQGMEEESEFQEVSVAKRIRLGTVDIFQGQEAKIVIVSLVRNTGNFETQSASIGFLKSSNRINVALSRAKHGLYILGNAANLRKNKTWSTILDELEAREEIGPGFPVVCSRHPNQAQVASKPGELRRYAPEGGCLLPCGHQLPCGHICPSVCHPVLESHRTMKCSMPCTKTPCPRSHPCSKLCSDNCGDCEFPMYDVTLPCGHTMRSVPCHLYDKLDEVKCTKVVTKHLPRCEHSALAECGKDPATIDCKEICSGIMDCCGKTCKSRCSDCERATTNAPTRGKTARIKRTKHKTHSCERLLYCQHNCGLDCHTKDKSCNSSCQKQCRQICSHQTCGKPCSTPCAPCMEPCAWSCSHYSCPVSCGSICSRLPCDEPCHNELKCGHPCPSICGEPCYSQKCAACLSPDQQQEIVDFIMQRRLEEIDLTSADISERLITLSCGHIFTVETLDGHCKMSEFYEIDDMGSFISTKTPPIAYQTPPTCPTCRGSITAMRYGRVTKRATLDILEQNVASTMSRSLDNLNPTFERVTGSAATLQKSAKSINSDASNVTTISQSRAEYATGKVTEPLPYDRLSRAAMHSVHGFSATEAKAWDIVVKDLLTLYRDVVKIANTRGAHIQAYEGALTTLYRLELASVTTDPSQASDKPEAAAMDVVNRKIGQPPHKADARFQIEAYFRTLELRFILAQIASSRIEGLSSYATEQDVVKHKLMWQSFAEFIYESCIADVQKALAMAQKTSASRQAARCTVYIARADFELFRFQALREAAQILGGPERQAARDDLSGRIMEKQMELKEQIRKWRNEYYRSRSIQNNAELYEEQEWFKENCVKKIERFIRDLEELEQYVRKGGEYQPLAAQEMLDIVKAFGFATSGHFYNCENGHPFVIGECGGAMQTARCPECRAPVGGSQHRLIGSNSRAVEFEEILRRQPGVREGYF